MNASSLLDKPDGAVYNDCLLSIIKVSSDDPGEPGRSSQMVMRAMDGHRMRPMSKVASEIDSWAGHRLPGRLAIAIALLDPQGPWGLLYTWPLRPEMPHYVWWRDARYERLPSGTLMYLGPCPWERSA